MDAFENFCGCRRTVEQVNDARPSFDAVPTSFAVADQSRTGIYPLGTAAHRCAVHRVILHRHSRVVADLASRYVGHGRCLRASVRTRAEDNLRSFLHKWKVVFQRVTGKTLSFLKAE